MSMSARRFTDTIDVDKSSPMKIVRFLWGCGVGLALAVAAACAGGVYSSVQHNMAIAQQQQQSAANTAAVDQVCKIILARDGKLQQLATQESLVWVGYKNQVPAGLSAKMSSIIGQRVTELAAIDAKGCNLPSPGTPLTP
jgi:hypothetical protein